VGAVVSVRRQCFDRLDIAAQLVADNDPRLAELIDQPLEKPLCSFSILSRLYENVEGVPIRVDGTPQQMLFPSNRDNDLIQMPFVIGVEKPSRIRAEGGLNENLGQHKNAIVPVTT
jgi:hypothetical protein